jgi:hypothetical protein
MALRLTGCLSILECLEVKLPFRISSLLLPSTMVPSLPEQVIEWMACLFLANLLDFLNSVLFYISAKASASWAKIFKLGIAAGCHIGFGSYLAITVGGNCPQLAEANPGLQKVCKYYCILCILLYEVCIEDLCSNALVHDFHGYDENRLSLVLSGFLSA